MGLTGDVETLRYLSICSGIEAATVAWHPLGWQAAAYSEIDPFASAVLAHHYPGVKNWGDMTKFQEWPDACRCVSHRHAESVRSPGSSSAGHGGSGRSSIHPDQGASSRGSNSAEGKGSTCEQCGGTAIDVLVGGTPCQSFSVAGLRAGLADPRGNLMLTFLAIAARYRPTWVVWENVPGVLSSNGGRDFGTFLGGLAVCGYGFAYRVLDAQYFGLAQRRRRVFVVGHLGDWRRAAAVLFDAASLRGDPAPRRATGEGVAPPIAGCSNGGGANGPGRTADDCEALIPQPHAAISPALKARDSKGVSSDGDGDGAILVPIAFGWQNSASQGASASASASHTPTLDKSKVPGVGIGMQVRRLTPRECERLQGVEDDYTLIPYRGKPAADGPRYKALGNSMAVPVMAWIGRRIQRVNDVETLRRVA